MAIMEMTKKAFSRAGHVEGQTGQIENQTVVRTGRGRMLGKSQENGKIPLCVHLRLLER
jgi:hypothetical protein